MNYPPIDEKIASGLMKQFWAEMVHVQGIEFSRATQFNSNKKLISKVKGKGSSRDQLKRISDFFGDTNLLTYIGGSERKPYLGLTVLYALKDREYNSWHERCLMGQILLTAPNPMFSQNFLSLFNIGEHAISRLFLRKENHQRHENGLVKVYSILEDIRPLCAWSAFWNARVIRSKLLYEHRNLLSPIVSAPSGLFLCKFSEDSQPILEVRTFIGFSDFNKTQKAVHGALSDAVSGFVESPLAFSPFVEKLGCDYPKLLTQLICLRLRSSAVTLAEQLVERVEDKKLASMLKVEIIASLDSGKCSPDNDDILKEIGLSAFLALGRNQALQDPEARNFLLN